MVLESIDTNLARFFIWLTPLNIYLRILVTKLPRKHFQSKVAYLSSAMLRFFKLLVAYLLPFNGHLLCI